MTPKNLLARMFRALSGQPQSEFARTARVDLSLLARYELGTVEPGPDTLARLAEAAGLTVAKGEELLRFFDDLRQPRRRMGAGIEDLTDRLSALLSRSYESLLGLPLPAEPPRPEDRERAGELWRRLEPLGEDERLAVARIAPEYASWALVERVCEESAVRAPHDAEEAASLARLAREIAVRVPGPEAWRNRVQAFAAACGAEVRRLWDSDAEPTPWSVPEPP
jgi:transcriptional regulator with XRE-family HTH domain